MHRAFFLTASLLAMAILFASFPAPAQQYPPPQQGYPPPVPPQQLDQVVQRIALYPDPLLAQILTASTYYNEIPEAANLGQPAQLPERPGALPGCHGRPSVMGSQRPGPPPVS